MFENILEMIRSAFLVGVAFLLLTTLLVMFDQKEIYHYEYIDLDNNNGTARNCSYKFEGHRKGGQGSPVCTLKDGTVLQVKQYKRVVTGTCVPAKDKNC